MVGKKKNSKLFTIRSSDIHNKRKISHFNYSIMKKPGKIHGDIIYFTGSDEEDLWSSAKGIGKECYQINKEESKYDE